MEGWERKLGPDHPDTLISVTNLAFVLRLKGDRPEARHLLRSYPNQSSEAEDTLAYNLACYECLEGNADEAKRLIGEHLRKHPEEKENALADDDLLAVRSYIEDL